MNVLRIPRTRAGMSGKGVLPAWAAAFGATALLAESVQAGMLAPLPFGVLLSAPLICALTRKGAPTTAAARRRLRRVR